MITLLQKSVFALAICGATLCSFAADAKPYVKADALPNALNFYPAPPETTSVQFMYDISQYMWGKAMLTPPRFLFQERLQVCTTTRLSLPT